jgi:hypothetical protein
VSIPSDIPGMVSESNDELELAISLDLTQDEHTELVYIGKSIAREYQQLRKESGLHPWDPIKLLYSSDWVLSQVQLDQIEKSTGYLPIYTDTTDGFEIIGSKQIQILESKLSIYLSN